MACAMFGLKFRKTLIRVRFNSEFGAHKPGCIASTDFRIINNYARRNSSKVLCRTGRQCAFGRTAEHVLISLRLHFLQGNNAIHSEHQYLPSPKRRLS